MKVGACILVGIMDDGEWEGDLPGGVGDSEVLISTRVT